MLLMGYLDNMANKTTLQQNVSDDSLSIDYIGLKNDENALVLLPVIIFVAILMIIGFVGNSLVVYVYTRPRPRTRNTTKRIFILTLAIFDLINCGLAMPFEIYDMRNQYYFQDKYVCKAFRFFETTMVMAGGFTLLAVSVDRYVNLVKSSKIIMTTARAKLLCVVCVVLGLMFAWPVLLFAGTESFEVRYKGKNFTAQECTGMRSNVYTFLSMKVYNFVLMFVFAFALVSLIVIYTFIGLKIFTRRRGSTKHGLAYISTNSSEADSMTTEMKDKKPTVRKPQRRAAKGTGLKARTSSVGYAIGKNKAQVRGSTLVFFSVTIVFILGFLPHLIVRTLKFTNVAFINNHSEDGMELLYNFLVRSYMLNSTANPFIYSLFNVRFRKDLSNAIRRCFGFGCTGYRGAALR